MGELCVILTYFKVKFYAFENQMNLLWINNNNNKTLLYSKQIDTKILTPASTELFEMGKNKKIIQIYDLLCFLGM